MKNIHILPTDKQIKNVGDLVKDQYGDIHIFTKNDGKEYGKTTTKLNIYITSDEEIKEGDWILDTVNDIIEKVKFISKGKLINGCWVLKSCKKVILTTDQSLDGVQSIDDEFLEWFVKNPSCEEIEIDKINLCTQTGLPCGMQCLSKETCNKNISYKTIIPKEEPKQRFEKYSERFDNKDNEIVEGIFNPETWGKRIKQKLPTELESVLAKITHLNELGLSQWYEVVYYVDSKWCSYSGSNTFQDGERVIDWKYCKDLI
jgi:hypothetical protein